jgi:hypothetical protein
MVDWKLRYDYTQKYRHEHPEKVSIYNKRYYVKRKSRLMIEREEGRNAVIDIGTDN